MCPHFESTLGIFNYVNVWPVYYDFLFEEKSVPVPTFFKLVFGDPSELNQLFKQRKLAVSCLSSNQYPLLQEASRVLPTVTLATQGPVQSVLLVSKSPIDKLAGREILATRASCVSTVLLKIILAKMKIPARVTVSGAPLDGLSGKAGAGAMLIGDEALRAGESFKDYFHYDLGQLWTQLTGKPFVWAIWGIQNEGPGEISEVLRQSSAHGVSQRSVIARRASERLGIAASVLERYYENLEYRWTDENLEGLLLFYRMAHELDLGPKCDSISFAANHRQAFAR